MKIGVSLNSSFYGIKSLYIGIRPLKLNNPPILFLFLSKNVAHAAEAPCYIPPIINF